MLPKLVLNFQAQVILLTQPQKYLVLQGYTTTPSCFKAKNTVFQIGKSLNKLYRVTEPSKWESQPSNLPVLFGYTLKVQKKWHSYVMCHSYVSFKINNCYLHQSLHFTLVTAMCHHVILVTYL
jgi:hypothetical protein